MISIRHMYFAIVALALSGLVFGCAASGKYGRLRANRSGMNIAHLSENWNDYHVYWTGASSARPLGIAFDPKGDDRKLQFGAWWEPIENQKELKDITVSLQQQVGTPIGTGIMANILYTRDILDPEGKQLFGYVYTYDIQVLVPVVDEKTMAVEIPGR